MTDVYTDDFTQAVTTTQAIEKALQFAGTCGTEIGKASVEASGPLGWLASATAATVASIVGTVYSLIEQLFVGAREVVDAVRYGFGSGEDPIYTIKTGPLSSSLLNADGNGLGSWTFGEPAEDVLAGLTSVLDTPEVDTGWEQYQTLHGQDGYFADNDPIAERWDYAYFRATCWQALCVIFGGSSPEAAAFRGWELSKYQRWSGWTDVDINKPDIALAETGIKLGDTWADFSAAYPTAVVGTGEGMSPVIDNPPWDGIFDGVWSWRLELDSGYVDGDTPEVPPDTPVVRMSGGEGPEPGCC